MKPKQFLELFSRNESVDFSELLPRDINSVPREDVQIIIEEIFEQHLFEVNDEQSRNHIARAMYYALKHLDVQYIRDTTTPTEIDRGGLSFDLFFKGGKIIKITTHR